MAFFKRIRKTLLITFILSSCIAFNAYAYDDVKGGEILVDSAVNLRAEATTDSTVLDRLYNGERVAVIGEEEDWYQVVYNGQTGYVSAGYVELSDIMNVEPGAAQVSPRRQRTSTAAVPRISTTGGPPPSGASGPGFRPISRTPSWRARPGRRSSSARPGRARPRSRSTAPPSSRGPYSTPPATASFSPRSRRRSPRTSRTGSTTSATTPTSAPASTCSP